MSERLQAAMDAHRTAPRTRGMDTSGPMRAALNAADEAMFSEEAVERAAKAIHDLGAYAWIWESRDEELKELYREDVRAVIAALKAGI